MDTILLYKNVGQVKGTYPSKKAKEKRTEAKC